MRKNRNKKLYLLLLLVLGISIGYAALASNLKINGTSGVKNASWIIHWANPVVTEGSVTDTKPTLSENNTNATYSVTLNKPGDFYEFTIDAVNEGTIDAEILKIESRFDGPDGTPIVTDGEHANLPAYLEYEVTYADEGHTPIAVKDSLDHGQSKKYRVRVAYSENITADDLQDDDITTTFYFEVEYKQKEKTTSNEESNNNEDTKITYVKGTKGNLQVGDTIRIGEDITGIEPQLFDVVSTDTDEGIVLLARYNLLVGDGPNSEPNDLIIKPTDPSYMYQNSQALGQRGRLATVDFAWTNYWHINNTDSVNLDYGTSYPAKVYNKNYVTSPVFSTSDSGDDIISFKVEGYSVAYYVEEYIKKLIEMGAPSSIQGRLLSYSEARNIFGCDEYSSCSSSADLDFLGNTEFWLSTAASGDTIWSIIAGRLIDSYYDYPTNAGVRPVIVIPKSEL